MTRAFVLGLGLWICFGCAGTAQDTYVPLHRNVTLESGDTWMENGSRYRLYGVQSCLRGTQFTNDSDRKLDCGEVSLAVLAAFIKDTQPVCAPIVRRSELTYVVCFAVVGGVKLDLGTIMVSRGFGFAALDDKGLPINPAYAVAEQQAKQSKSGLWHFPDMPHPALLLGTSAQKRNQQ
jgi:endonuclease YncB( thermonuclease family)